MSSTWARTSPGSRASRCSGEPGQKITLRFAERLNPDGSIYTTNLRSATATDTYICRGDGVETWEPRFTYHGFQYIEVTRPDGAARPPTRSSAWPSAATRPSSGAFECSDPMLNQLRSNVYWTQRANFIDIPTDCPQRDERLGWTGDAQVYVRTATLNCDVEPFFTKWLVDLDEDGQRADGEFPMVAPVKVAGRRRRPGVGGRRGDLPVDHLTTSTATAGMLERHYAAMTRFIAFCKGPQQAEPPAARQVPLLRGLAEHQGRHAEGRHLHRLFRLFART